MANAKKSYNDWYSISVDSLRAWGSILMLALVVLAVFVGYRYWVRYDQELEALNIIDQAQHLRNRLNREPRLGEFQNEFTSAEESLESARQHYDQSSYSPALADGKRSRALFQSILEALGGGDGANQAQFITLEGRVEYRRGDGGEWQPAQPRVALSSGDHVRTADNGSAEIMFRDGTLYTAGPSTQFIVNRDRGSSEPQSIRMAYGWVNLNTSRHGSTVETPGAEARVRGESEAAVGYDRDTEVALFASYQGGMEVTDDRGETRTLDELQRVVRRGSELSQPAPLPPGPAVFRPAENAEVDFDTVRRLVLAWEPVAGASRYNLQVSRNHLFVDNVIDDDRRSRTQATLGVRGEGVFLWRVAAVTSEGLRGVWSPVRSFRVASDVDGVADGADTTPPLLELGDIKSYGSIFIVDGRTEPAATIEVNGESAQVAADGSFTKTVQIEKEGWSFLEIVARDASGNAANRRQRVFVEIF